MILPLQKDFNMPHIKLQKVRWAKIDNIHTYLYISHTHTFLGILYTQILLWVELCPLQKQLLES